MGRNVKEKAHDASGRTAKGDMDQVLEREAVLTRMNRIKRKILVLSGKGGVGKSTIAACLATALAQAGKRVGLLDVDIHGPSIPKLLGLEGQGVRPGLDGLEPVEFDAFLKVISIGFILQHRDDAVIWRGPLKMGVIKQFLKDVAWGDLDALVVDCPPGTGDEPLSVVQLLGKPDGAIIVTTPQDLAVADVRRCVTFCRQLELPVIGVVENMSGFVCPHCGECVDIFKSGGGEAMAHDMDVPFLGRIPIDPGLVEAGDRGQLYFQAHADTEAAEAFRPVVQPIMDMIEKMSS